IVIGCAKAGIRLVNKSQLEQAKNLVVAADVNAVPPAGIEGIGVNDMGKELEVTPNQALGIGAL
ncbi:MAG: methylenetetrahydromethanopterin dehydrogenase, partial [Candidatus Aminicenantes bacterium]|nr:methylenetetrahydromethanopterin dehydrogenase [Candidatus Aminicenantes bacterium]